MQKTSEKFEMKCFRKRRGRSFQHKTSVYFKGFCEAAGLGFHKEEKQCRRWGGGESAKVQERRKQQDMLRSVEIRY